MNEINITGFLAVPFTILNFLMLGYSIWLRAQIKKAGKSIDENHKKTLGLVNDIFTSSQFYHYKEFKNYDQLTSKNDWYIFGLVNLSSMNKNRSDDNKIEMFEAFEVYGAAWCKRPEEVGLDYLIVAKNLLIDRKDNE